MSPAELLDALVLLRRVQSELAGLEPIVIAAARAAGVSWQAWHRRWASRAGKPLGISRDVDAGQDTGSREGQRTAAAMRSTAEQLRLAAETLHDRAAASPNARTLVRLRVVAAARRPADPRRGRRPGPPATPDQREQGKSTADRERPLS